jgi:hypothetical protein
LIRFQRRGIIELFKEDLYTGFIAAMMWGGINGTRPQTAGGNDTSFRRLLEHPIEKVEKAIQYATDKIKSGDIADLCLEFESGGEHCLPGVGHAYYTKLFYFLGQVHNVALQPLIFDKWTSNAHCALLIQNSNTEKLYYKGTNRHYSYSLKIPTSRAGKSNIYFEYVRDFNCWAKELSEINPDKEISPSKLEEFLFGQPLNRNRTSTNPRRELWRIIEGYFGEQKLTKVNLGNRRTGETAMFTSNKPSNEINEGAKYYYLQEHFKQCSNDLIHEVNLTTEEIESILSKDFKNELPNWAFTRAPGYWSNNGYREHVQKRAWLSQGYFVTHHSISESERSGLVTFTKQDNLNQGNG